MGTPALAANVPALREVGGDLAKYFEPDDPAALASLIDQLHTNSEALTALKNKIAHNRASLRTWKDVAEDIIEATSHAPALT